MVTTKQDQLATLEQRLENGFRKIGAKMQQGISVTHWEDTWIELLRQYEQISDELAATPLEQAEMNLGVRAEREVV